MDVNDDAPCLNDRVVRTSIVGTPPGASSLLQEIDVILFDGCLLACPHAPCSQAVTRQTPMPPLDC